MLVKIVHELRKAKGTNAKLEVLKKHNDNRRWKRFLEYTYDCRKTYGVAAPRDSTFKEVKVERSMFLCLDRLIKRQITGNKAKALALHLSEHYGELPRLVLGRSVKAGISIKTINKAYPDLIFTFDTMKGKDVEIRQYPVVSSIKYDGVKVFAIKYPSERIELLTSSGIPFNLLSLKREITAYPPGVYEGELISGEGKIVDRPVITGKLNSLLSGTIDDLDVGSYNFMVYDYINYSEWQEKKSTTTYKDRIHQYVNYVQPSHVVKLVPMVIHHTLEEVVEYFELLTANGYEGSMHRYLEDFYEWTGDKRTDRLIKKKAKKQCILTCIGTIPHSNPAKGLTGALVCTGAIRDKDVGVVEVEVKVGSGLSKFDILYDEGRYIDQQIEVLYNSVTTTKDGNSLFLPRYKRIVGEPD